LQEQRGHQFWQGLIDFVGAAPNQEIPNPTHPLPIPATRLREPVGGQEHLESIRHSVTNPRERCELNGEEKHLEAVN